MEYLAKYEDPSNLPAATATGTGEGNLLVIFQMDLETEEQKKMRLVQAEVNRMKLLPASSAYVIHRLKVLNKMTQLLSVAPEKRSKVEVDELELLFAGMSV